MTPIEVLFVLPGFEVDEVQEWDGVIEIRAEFYLGLGTYAIQIQRMSTLAPKKDIYDIQIGVDEDWQLIVTYV